MIKEYANDYSLFICSWTQWSAWLLYTWIYSSTYAQKAVRHTCLYADKWKLAYMEAYMFL